MQTTAERGKADGVPDGTAEPVVRFEHVALAFDDKVVLEDVSFTLAEGHTIIILGASGSGKSTILKIVTGLLSDDAISGRQLLLSRCWILFLSGLK